MQLGLLPEHIRLWLRHAPSHGARLYTQSQRCSAGNVFHRPHILLLPHALCILFISQFSPLFLFYVLRHFETCFTFPVPVIVLCLQPVLYISENIAYQALPFHRSWSFHIQITKLTFTYTVLLNHKPGEVGESFHAAQEIIRNCLLWINKYSHEVWLCFFAKKRALEKHGFVGVRVTQPTSGIWWIIYYACLSKYNKLCLRTPSKMTSTWSRKWEETATKSWNYSVLAAVKPKDLWAKASRQGT